MKANYPTIDPIQQTLKKKTNHINYDSSDIDPHNKLANLGKNSTKISRRTAAEEGRKDNIDTESDYESGDRNKRRRSRLRDDFIEAIFDKLKKLWL